jgi:hypothetical protein
VARLLAYAATGGAEGIITPGDLKVVATTVPGGTVDIAPGDCLIRHRGQGGDSQTYAARNHTRDNVSLASTGGTSRSDLIVAQIEDPFIAGEPWQTPADVTAGPYIYTRVIPNVPPWTTRVQEVTGFEGRTAITLARVDIPANTGTITNDMIVDLRELAMPRSKRQLYVHSIAAAKDLKSTTGVQWLSDEIAVDIPHWATSCQIVTTVSPAYQMGPNSQSQLLAKVWPVFVGKPGFETVVDINQTSWAGNGATVHPIISKWDTIEDPSKREPLMTYAGTTQKLQIWGVKQQVIGTDTGYLRVEPYGRSMLNVDVQFSEDPV